MALFDFTVEGTSGHARAAAFETAHGTAKTPMFMPVGTQRHRQRRHRPTSLHDLGAQVVLANTYHLSMRPGADRYRRGGRDCTRFMQLGRADSHRLGRLPDILRLPIRASSTTTVSWFQLDLRRIEDPVDCPRAIWQIQQKHSEPISSCSSTNARPYPGRTREFVARAPSTSPRDWARSLPGCAYEAPGSGAFRHRAGRHAPRPAPSVGPRACSRSGRASVEAGRQGFPRIRHRRLFGGRGARCDVRNARAGCPRASRTTKSALSHGGGQPHDARARRSRGSRHVRLRASHPHRPHGHRVLVDRPHEHAQRKVSRAISVRSTMRAPARSCAEVLPRLHCATSLNQSEMLGGMLLSVHNLHYLHRSHAPGARSGAGGRVRGVLRGVDGVLLRLTTIDRVKVRHRLCGKR